jgi:hypothetical protein
MSLTCGLLQCIIQEVPFSRFASRDEVSGVSARGPLVASPSIGSPQAFSMLSFPMVPLTVFLPGCYFT